LLFKVHAISKATLAPEIRKAEQIWFASYKPVLMVC
jgi:hypothetical protein